jgi:hypothetical protein
MDMENKGKPPLETQDPKLITTITVLRDWDSHAHAEFFWFWTFQSLSLSWNYL